MSALKKSGICLLLIAIWISICLNNITLFFFTTDIIWSILNYLDDSQIEYDKGYLYLIDDAYTPVTKEVIDYNLNVSGRIPRECDGVIFKIGSNPKQYKNGNVGIKYNWFDGNGMIHSIRLISRNNTAHYTNTWIKTNIFKMENKYNRSIYAHFFGGTQKNGIIGLFKMLFQEFIILNKWSPVHLPFDERGHANTAILHFNNKLFALYEAASPFQFTYNIKTATLESIGNYKFNEWNYHFTAHPKIDKHENNRLFTHSAYLLPQADQVVVGMTSIDDKKTLISTCKIQLKSAGMMHDMVITEKYIIIFDLNMHFGKEVFIKSKFTQIIGFDNSTNSKIGVIIRKQFEIQKNNVKIKWFDITPCWVFHFVNAWNQNNIITIIGNRYNNFDMNMFQINKNEDNMQYLDSPKLFKWTINMKTNVIEENTMSIDTQQEFANIHPYKVGVINRFMWSTTGYYRNDGLSMFDGFIKYDLQKQEIVGRVKYNKNETANSEIILIPKHKIIPNNGDEDDVYIAHIIYNYDTRKSRMEIYDGKTMNAKQIAIIQIKTRIPMAIHSLFVASVDLQQLQL